MPSLICQWWGNKKGAFRDNENQKHQKRSVYIRAEY